MPHHVTQRGTRRMKTFFCHGDYLAYLSFLEKSAGRQKLEIWAYCLMPNHVHLIVVPREKHSLWRGIGCAHWEYAKMINERNGWTGSLWQDRFSSFPMDEPYLLAATRYVLRNPVVADLVENAEDWPYSSARIHLEGNGSSLVRTEALNPMISDWYKFLRQPNTTDQSEDLEAHIRNGFPFGSEDFVSRLERGSGRRLRPKKRGPAPAGILPLS
ncbi:MAG: transposase [Planctomycetota bacterium]|nr:transposase [Planctomycetota bacterium]